MKKFFCLLLAMMLVVSLLGIMSASAAARVSISGNSTVVKGRTYTYKVTVSGSASTIMGDVTCGGVFSGSRVTYNKDSASGYSESISATATISVTVSASATPGETGTITVSGGGSEVDANANVTTFNISGSKTVTVAERAPSTPKPEGDPEPTPEPTEWDLLKDRLDALEQGGSLTLSITQDPKIPRATLGALKAKQGKLELDFGAYTCSIDGAALSDLPEALESLDLSVAMTTDPALSSAANGLDVYQLHFAHSGPLPGRFVYKFAAPENKPGDTLYLYYYYGSSNVVEAKQEVVVDEDGFVTFSIYHCSSYFVTGTLMEGAAGVLTVQQDQTEIDALIDAAVQAALADFEADLAPAAADTDIAAATASAFPLTIDTLPLLAAAALGGALVAVIITMFACRAGLFKRKGGRHAE